MVEFQEARLVIAHGCPQWGKVATLTVGRS
jgi:hypothetical protein